MWLASRAVNGSYDVTFVVRDIVDPPTETEIRHFVEAVKHQKGRAVLSDDMDSALSGHSLPDDVQVVAVELRDTERGSLLAYGQLQLHSSRGLWNLEVVFDEIVSARDGDPDADTVDIRSHLLAEAVGGASRRGGGRIDLWVPYASEAWDRLAMQAGFEPDRDLLQMRASLPLARDPVGGPPANVRAFRVGADEEDWLGVNNRAFTGHAEQGAWTLEDLRAREAEPWFDPEGFLLHERDGQLAASCWTKIHHTPEEPLGEIYVISVNPDFQGLGLGRALTLAGLHHLADRGVRTAMLYVAADNPAALAIYRSLGFEVHHVDRAYTTTVDAVL